jgi:uncharacterized oligopeptide transporter (OPT) family protein
MADHETRVEKSVEERDQEWLQTVYKGDKERQLTARAIIAGMLFGGLMSVSNVYVGLKSGWGLGVDIAAVIVIFAVFKGLRTLRLIRSDFGMMENTIMMTVAVAASWISSAGLVSAVPALTMLTGRVLVWWQLTVFIGVVLYLGLFMAIPLKRQMIHVDNLRFPGNIPTGETLKAMYSHGGEAMKKARALGLAGLVGMVLAGVRDGFEWIPGLFNLPLKVLRVPLSNLTLSLEPSVIFIAIGALFGIKVGVTMLVGLLLNYAVLAPNLIQDKVIKHAPPTLVASAAMKPPLSIPAGGCFTLVLEEADRSPMLRDGSRVDTLRYTWAQPATYASLAELKRDLNASTLLDGSPNPLSGKVAVRDTLSKAAGTQVLYAVAGRSIYWQSRLAIPEKQGKKGEAVLSALGFEEGKSNQPLIGGFRNISAWSLWPGATVLVVGGLLALAFQWRTLGKTFGSIFSSLRSPEAGHKKGPLDDIEIPMSWFLPGFLVTGVLAAVMLNWIFGIHWYMGLIAVLLTFFLAAVAARAGAEIGINPIGALGKVTQLTYGVIAPGNVPANLMTAGLTAGAAASCSDTVGNLKVGHMVGANPRKQFIGQLFGVLAGSFIAVPAYYILVPDANTLGGDKFPAPSALVWKGVAQVLSQGIRTLPPSAVMAVGIAFVVGVIIVIIDRVFPKARPYTPSPAALGIALTVNAYTSFAMFLGALIAWFLERKASKWNDMYTIPVASGCIAGESIMGVVIAALLASGIKK